MINFLKSAQISETILKFKWNFIEYALHFNLDYKVHEYYDHYDLYYF